MPLTLHHRLARDLPAARRLSCQALPVKRGANNVATFMRNVLNAFLKPGPLPGSEYVGEEKLWRLTTSGNVRMAVMHLHHFRSPAGLYHGGLKMMALASGTLREFCYWNRLQNGGRSDAMKPGRLRIAIGLLVLGAMPAMAAEFKPETPGTTTLPPTMHRVYLADAVLPHMADGRVYVLDRTDLALKGMMEAGFAGMMLAVPDKRRVYVATTFYERLTRGKRTDVIQVFDDQSLKVVEEIPVSTHRAQALSYRSLFQRSSDGNLLLLQNATPATSVTVVDPTIRKQLEVPTPGCYGIYPALTQPKRFTTLCGDGTMGTYTINAKLSSAERKTGAKLFDADADPLFIHAERDADAYIFLSFKGKLLRASLEGETANIVETLDMTGADTRDWAPGGYQPMTVDAKAGIVYVLMHQGTSDGAHKNPSSEIWAYDLRGKKLVARSSAMNLISITLSPSDPTVLFAIDPLDGKVERFTVDAQTRKVSAAGEIKLGETAALIEAP
jgi:methylamine dehydrogenase heavy chain